MQTRTSPCNIRPLNAKMLLYLRMQKKSVLIWFGAVLWRITWFGWNMERVVPRLLQKPNQFMLMDWIWMMGHDTIGPRLILLWWILVMMMMSVSKMRVKTSTKFKSMKVNKQSFRGIIAPLFQSFYVTYQRNGGLKEGSNRAFVQRV